MGDYDDDVNEIGVQNDLDLSWRVVVVVVVGGGDDDDVQAQPAYLFLNKSGRGTKNEKHGGETQKKRKKKEDLASRVSNGKSDYHSSRKSSVIVEDEQNWREASQHDPVVVDRGRKDPNLTMMTAVEDHID